MTQHELVDAQPVVSETATVRRKTAMDRRRSTAIRDAVARLLRRIGRREWADDVVGGDAVDWERLWDRVHERGVGGRTERTFRTLHERDARPHPSLITVELDPQTPFDYVPGEYVTVHYRHVPRPYSIASSPNRDRLEICVRRVRGGRLTSLLCDDLAVGDRLAVRGPFSGSFVGGEFLLDEPSGRDVAFLATGTGVAPLRSMIEYAFEEGFDEYRGEQRDVWLFLGAPWVDDLPYHEWFRALDAEHANFHYVPTLSRERLLTDWPGETAYVQQTFAKYLDSDAVSAEAVPKRVRPYLGERCRADVVDCIDPAELEVYACGINAMVYETLAVARRVGVPSEAVRGEGYG